MHLLPDSAALPAAYLRAYAASEGLLFETDVAALQDPQTQARLMSAAQNEAGLEAETGAPLAKRTRQHLRKLGLPDTMCDPVKAWFCAMTLELMQFVRAGFRPELGVDQQLYEHAQRNDKPSTGLELLPAHLQLFTGMDPKTGRELLAATLEDASPNSPAELLRVWQSGDLNALEDLVRDMACEQPALYRRLLSERNLAWMPALERSFRSSTPQLAVVGAAHLAGPDGLLRLLEARGFALERLE